MSHIERCCHCRFWESSVGDRVEGVGGDCKRRAPVAVLYEPARIYPANAKADWPRTLGSDWCGDYEVYLDFTQEPLAP